jgi:hypothetical protein
MTGPSYFDTGRLSHFFTYLCLIFLPMFIIFICCSAIPENPASHCFLMAMILWGLLGLLERTGGPFFKEEQALPGNNERKVEGSPFCPDISLTQGWVLC